MPRARKRHESDDEPLEDAATIHTMQFDVTPTTSASYYLNTQPPTTLLPPTSMPPTRSSHGKKRDASYIPRPPNAFILFRSSFIRSQRVPGNVEGNHSTLSKIIGKCWKALSPEERERWEFEAVIAQAEHRKKYPDWRFRPGANAAAAAKLTGSPVRRKKLSAKEKNKSEGDDDDDEEYQEKGKTRAKNNTKASVRRKYPTRGKEKGKEKGQGPEEDEERLAKIAELLVDGVKGHDLETAIEEWEDSRRRKRKRSDEPAGGESSRCRRRTEVPVDPPEEEDEDEDEEMDELELEPEADVNDAEHESSTKGWRDSTSPSSSNFSTIPASTEFSKIPLTQMFKREKTVDPELLAFMPAESAAGSVTGGEDGCQQPDSWWTVTTTTAAAAAAFEADTSGLGYDPVHILSFGQGFHIDDDQDESPIPRNDAIGWTRTTGGLVTAIVDPFLNTSAIRTVDVVNEKCPDISPRTSVPVPSPVPAPTSGLLGSCSSMPLSSLSPPLSASTASAASATSQTATMMAAASSAETAETVLEAQQQVSPLLYPRPRVGNTQQPHYPTTTTTTTTASSYSHSQPHSSHTQLHHPHPRHHHARSFSSLADWDGAASATGTTTTTTTTTTTSALPHVRALAVRDQSQIPISVHGLNPGVGETKQGVYGIDGAATAAATYDLGYYTAPSDWQSTYG